MPRIRNVLYPSTEIQSEMRYMKTQLTSTPQRFWAAAAGGVAFLGTVAQAAPFL